MENLTQTIYKNVSSFLSPLPVSFFPFTTPLTIKPSVISHFETMNQ